MTEEVFDRATNGGKGWELLIKLARARKDTWSSRAAAREWMAERLPWKRWTPRSLDLFVVSTALFSLMTGGCC